MKNCVEVLLHAASKLKWQEKGMYMLLDRSLASLNQEHWSPVSTFNHDPDMIN
jgi:hypothetical protein